MQSFFDTFDYALYLLAWYACWSPALTVPLYIRCYCCTLACTILTDNFGTDTIANYDQRSGTWTVGSGTLSTASASGLIISNTTLRDDIGQVVVSIAGIGTGEIAGVVGAYIDDDNYLLAELECVNSGTSEWEIRIIERVAAANTTIIERTQVFLNALSFHGIKLCWNGTHASITLDASPGANAMWQSTLVGNKAGMAVTNNTGTMNFDGFNLLDSFDNISTCAECDTHCASACIGHTSTMQVQADISSIGSGTCGDCSALNTTHILDLWQEPLAGSSLSCTFTITPAGIGPCTSLRLSYQWLTTNNRFDILGAGACVFNSTGAANQDCSSAPAQLTPITSCSGCDISPAVVDITPL